MATQRVRPVILVGTDGSAGSIQALRWALRQAHATGGEVRAVLAWENSAPGGVIATADDVDWHGIATAAVQEATAAEPDISVPVTTEVVNAHPANALVEESSDADLLVVGSRGHGRVLKRVLGSVSDHCTHHAHCPVVVVPRPPRLPTVDERA